jgi:hypothetical protein
VVSVIKARMRKRNSTEAELTDYETINKKVFGGK